jgi:two-component system response regulator HydG
MEDRHANLSRAALSSQAGVGGLIGQSAPMHLLYDPIGKVSQSTSPVLVIGDTGTGKELVARAIQFKGSRRENSASKRDKACRLHGTNSN